MAMTGSRDRAGFKFCGGTLQLELAAGTGMHGGPTACAVSAVLRASGTSTRSHGRGMAAQSVS